MCAAAALSWGLSVLAAFAVFKDPAVAADFDSGTHTRTSLSRLLSIHLGEQLA